jgi:hypothetical protein
MKSDIYVQHIYNQFRGLYTGKYQPMYFWTKKMKRGREKRGNCKRKGR